MSMDNDDLSGLLPAKPKLLMAVMPGLFRRELVSTAAWLLIKPGVDELAKASQDLVSEFTAKNPEKAAEILKGGGNLGEYTSWSVYCRIDVGILHLWMGFMDETGTEWEDVGKQEQFVWDCILKQKKEKFAGYFMTQNVQDGIHIFLAHIEPTYRNSKVFQQAFGEIEANARRLGAPGLFFTSARGGWGAVGEALGFVPVFTNDLGVTDYKLDLTKK
jgi:hypothetical protein